MYPRIDILRISATLTDTDSFLVCMDTEDTYHGYFTDMHCASI